MSKNPPTILVWIGVAFFVALLAGFIFQRDDGGDKVDRGPSELSILIQRSAEGCQEGDMADCDTLYMAAYDGSPEEYYGATCGRASYPVPWISCENRWWPAPTG